MKWLLLFAFATCTSQKAPESVAVKITAHDTTWSADSGGREIHVPLGARVDLELKSRDYISIFAAPALGLRDFAAPGLPAKFEFRADKPGRYELRSDELCGRPHTDRSRGHVVVEDAAAYFAWKAHQ